MFMSKYQLQANFAANRFSIGVPATVSVGGAEDSHSPKALHVAEAVQAYITVMDALRLNMCAVDQVSPFSDCFRRILPPCSSRDTCLSKNALP